MTEPGQSTGRGDCVDFGIAAGLAVIQDQSTHTRERAVRKLMGEETRRGMAAAVIAAPDAVPVMRWTGGIRKLRLAGSGRGRKGNIRTVHFQNAGPETVDLPTAHAKGNREYPAPKDTKALSRLVTAIRKEATER